MSIVLLAIAVAFCIALLAVGVLIHATRKSAGVASDDARVGDRVRALALDLMFLPEASSEFDSTVEGIVTEVTEHELKVLDHNGITSRCLRPGAVILERAPAPPPTARKLTVVVAKLGEHCYESRVRDGIGEGSRAISGVPVCTERTADDAIRAATAYLEHWEGPVEIVVREDPSLTGE